MRDGGQGSEVSGRRSAVVGRRSEPLIPSAPSRLLVNRFSAPYFRTLARSHFRTSLHCLLPIAYCLLSLPALAGELLSGRFYTVPENIYVGQAFEIHFELEVTGGSEVQDLRIGDFPNNPEVLTVGQLQTRSKNRVAREGQPVDVLHFTADARGHKPVGHTFNPRLECMLVVRRASGFFSQWQSHPKQLQLAPFSLRIQPLPETGRPAHFSGAVGTFRLTGQLSQSSVHPGDILTLTLELAGNGWLNNATMPAPPSSPLFKTYPAKEKLREPLRVQTEQVFIPQSTNATEIAAARFSFFNPTTGVYEESVAGPFPLTFSATPAAPQPSDIRILAPSESADPGVSRQSVTIERVNQSVRHAVPLLIVGASVLAAFFVFFQLYGRHTRLAFLFAALLLAAGGAAGAFLSGKSATAQNVTSQRTEALFAPARAAMPLFILTPGTPITPLESVGAWVRVDASGRRGWIPADAIKDAPGATPQK